MQCPICKNNLNPGEQVCSKCGTNIIYCDNCGAANKQEEKFCGRCGNVLAGKDFSEGETFIPPYLDSASAKNKTTTENAPSKPVADKLSKIVNIKAIGALGAAVVLCFGIYNFSLVNKNDSVSKQTLQQEAPAPEKKLESKETKSEDKAPAKSEKVGKIEIDNNKKYTDARVERAKNMVPVHYKPQRYYQDNIMYPMVYGKQGVSYYIDLYEATIDHEYTLEDGSKIYEFSTFSISSDGISASKSRKEAYVRISDKVEPVSKEGEHQWKHMEYFGFTAQQYNTALLLTDYFQLAK
ncbi:MAG: zinc ribbon domain-containing protein [Phascolarctobacterium sp.]|uniref:zinc ribbon domain-containing protein n=1 Tax=Phascolarctobacterium sp. TaxID=2049039 RepID=UPI0026DC84CA|nr:zinc ribbon domain-containing protein [Phascolarctobacterium sp.]MDO4921885.1 zinc ribbon domain-containing protein [Phascolarctobacterium sp.]